MIWPVHDRHHDLVLNGESFASQGLLEDATELVVRREVAVGNAREVLVGKLEGGVGGDGLY